MRCPGMSPSQGGMVPFIPISAPDNSYSHEFYTSLREDEQEVRHD